MGLSRLALARTLILTTIVESLTKPCADRDHWIEEGLEAIVGGARQDHAAQDFDLFVTGQRCGNRGAAHEAVGCVEQFGVGLADADRGRGA